MKIDIYTTPGCVFCAKAKAVLDCLRLEYNVKLIEGQEAKADLMDKLQANFGLDDDERTFPKIFIDGKLVKGYSDLKRLVILGKIKRA